MKSIGSLSAHRRQISKRSHKIAPRPESPVDGNRREPVVDKGRVIHRLTVVDLTDIRDTEDLLKHSLANWYSLVHNAPDVILLVRKDGSITFANRQVWGYSATALIDTNVLDYLSDSAKLQVRSCLDKAFRFNRRSTCEFNEVNGDMSRWYHLSFGCPHSDVVDPKLPRATMAATAAATTSF
jgi:PAS domain S-box-containing protein